MQQKQELLTETQKTNEVMQELKGKESELLKVIEKHKKEQNRLNKYIAEVIEREMAKAAKLAEEEAKKKEAAAAKLANAPKPPPKPGAPVEPAEPANNPVKNLPKPRVVPEREAQPLLSTPNDIELSSNFEGNKGKLYWPVSQGVISDHFGVHPHPLAPKVMINNSGIDIQTSPNATVHAVFDGVVSSVFSTIGDNQTVIVHHANYFTVYNNLTNVAVKIGQHVNAKQALGTVINNDEGVPVINFQIWKATGKKGSTMLNPEQWIGRAHSSLTSD